MKPDKPRTWLNPQSSSFDQDIQALGGTIIHLQTSNQIFDPNSTTLSALYTQLNKANPILDGNNRTC